MSNNLLFFYILFYNISMFKNKKNLITIGLILLISSLIFWQGDSENPTKEVKVERLLTTYTTTTTRTASVE